MLLDAGRKRPTPYSHSDRAVFVSADNVVCELLQRRVSAAARTGNVDHLLTAEHRCLCGVPSVMY